MNTYERGSATWMDQTLLAKRGRAGRRNGRSSRPVVRKKSIPTEFPLNSECEEPGPETARTARSREHDLRRRLCPT